MAGLNRFDGRRIKAGVNAIALPPRPLPLELTALPENGKCGRLQEELSGWREEDLSWYEVCRNHLTTFVKDILRSVMF